MGHPIQSRELLMHANFAIHINCCMSDKASCFSACVYIGLSLKERERVPSAVGRKCLYMFGIWGIYSL